MSSPKPSFLPPLTGPGLTTVVLRVQGLPTAQEGVEQKCPVVHSQTQVAWLGLRTSGQVGAKCRHCNELHQFHIRHMTKATIVGINSSHLERVNKGRPCSVRGPGMKNRRGIYCFQFPDHGGEVGHIAPRIDPTLYPSFSLSMPAGHTTFLPPDQKHSLAFSTDFVKGSTSFLSL